MTDSIVSETAAPADRHGPAIVVVGALHALVPVLGLRAVAVEVAVLVFAILPLPALVGVGASDGLRCAPIAARTPSSRVREVTTNERRPWTPNAAMKSASPPNAVKEVIVEVLRAAGQPHSRLGNEFVYCTETSEGAEETVTVTFDEAGKVASTS